MLSEEPTTRRKCLPKPQGTDGGIVLSVRRGVGGENSGRYATFGGGERPLRVYEPIRVEARPVRPRRSGFVAAAAQMYRDMSLLPVTRTGSTILIEA